MQFLKGLIYLLSFLVFIALCYISSFNTYQTDDYIFAATTNKNGAVSNAIHFYFNWGGRYFSYSVNTLNPAGKLKYNWLPKVFPPTLWILFIVGVTLLLKILHPNRWWKLLAKALVFFLFYTISLLSISEHFFWLSGSIIYFLPTILFIYYIIFHLILPSNFWKLLFLSLLIIILIGSNEIIGLVMFVFLGIEWLRNRNKQNLGLFILGFICFAIMILAPGNFIRRGDIEIELWDFTYKFVGIFFANMFLVTLKVLPITPLFILIFEKELIRIKQKLQYIPIYILGAITFAILVFSAVIHLAQLRSLEFLNTSGLLLLAILMLFKYPKIKNFAVLSIGIILLPPLFLFPAKIIYFDINYNLYNIYTEVAKTDLQSFQKEITNRHKRLRESKENTISLQKIKNIPRVLYFEEVGTNEERNYINQQLEEFYHKKTVVLENKP